MIVKKPSSHYDIVVIGAGHAGIEASYIAEKMECSVLLVCFSFSMAANMPCNPNIGGSAKGIVVREIDALGGLMGRMADKKGSLLQMKVLNMSKGPGVRSLRAQEDKIGYPKNVQQELLKRNIDIFEGEVKKIVAEDNKVKGVIIDKDIFVSAEAVILATGTFLESRTLRGEEINDEGADGQKASHGLSASLKELNINLIRLKTGTPPRLDPSTIDFTGMEEEIGTMGNYAFSYDTEEFMKVEDMIKCHLLYTNSNTHKIIRDNLSKSSMYSGTIKGVGPRYCPSIEDKIVRFKDKERHQLFLEPESLFFSSMYLQGFSTSMPRDIQEEMVHSLKGLENAKFLKYAYAIEYDAIEPSQLDKTMMVKNVSGLYIAGQMACTSGYEEAAALGLMCGINAALKIQRRDPFILRRDEAYIGIMIDDIVSKGSLEPYRLLSSRSEFRLMTRSDNADDRLLEKGYQLKTNSYERYMRYKRKNELILTAIKTLEETKIKNNEELSSYIMSLNYPKPNGNENLKQTIKRQNTSYKCLKNIVSSLPDLTDEEMFKLETEIRYEGYIVAEKKEAERRKKQQDLPIPDDIDYSSLTGISLEAIEKLSLKRPKTLFEASMINNVHPCDIDVLSFYIRKRYKKD